MRFMGKVWTFFSYLHPIAGPCVMLLYPLYASVDAIESPTKADDEQWLAYWIIYSFFTLFEIVAEPLLSWFLLALIFSYTHKLMTYWRFSELNYYCVDTYMVYHKASIYDMDGASTVQGICFYLQQACERESDAFRRTEEDEGEEDKDINNNFSAKLSSSPSKVRVKFRQLARQKKEEQEPTKGQQMT